MKEKNIENIMMQLVSLNVPITIEYLIRANICLQQDHVQILYRQKKGDDCMNTKFYFERDKNEYFCRYYDASLRKEISIPGILLNEVDVNNLHQKMRNVNWDVDLNNVSDETAKNKMLWEKDQGVEKIITDLEQLSETQEGAAIAERLKIKFWIDTPLAYLVPNFNSLRNQIEISQRYAILRSGSFGSGSGLNIKKEFVLIPELRNSLIKPGNEKNL